MGWFPELTPVRSQAIESWLSTLEAGDTFQISIPEALSRLKRKLDGTCLPDEVDSTDWDYGVPLADIKWLAERWKN